MRDLAAGGVRRRDESRVGTKFIGAREALDLVDLQREDGGQNLAHARQGLQPHGERVRGVVRGDDFFQRAHLCLEQSVDRKIVVAQRAVGWWQRRALHPRFPFVTENILHGGTLEERVAVDHAVDAVADHRAHAREPEALAHDVFSLAHVA